MSQSPEIVQTMSWRLTRASGDVARFDLHVFPNTMIIGYFSSSIRWWNTISFAVLIAFTTRDTARWPIVEISPNTHFYSQKEEQQCSLKFSPVDDRTDRFYHNHPVSVVHSSRCNCQRIAHSAHVPCKWHPVCIWCFRRASFSVGFATKQTNDDRGEETEWKYEPLWSPRHR